MLQPRETINSTKTALLQALQSRGVTEINGDRLPEDVSSIEFGVAVDRNDLEKGWTPLKAETPEFTDAETPRRNAGKKSSGSTNLQSAGLRNGQSVAFRFQKHGEEVAKKDGEELDIDQDLEDPGWDVVVPKFDDEEEME